MVNKIIKNIIYLQIINTIENWMYKNKDKWIMFLHRDYNKYKNNKRRDFNKEINIIRYNQLDSFESMIIHVERENKYI